MEKVGQEAHSLGSPELVSRGSGGGQCASGQGQIEWMELRTGAGCGAGHGSKILTNADCTGAFSRHPEETDQEKGQWSLEPK